MPDVSLVVTSCGRHDLLEKTLRSFIQHNRFPIKETIIVEDSAEVSPEWFAKLDGLGWKVWITNGCRKGQIYSIDRAYAEVKTPYIAHWEDDWEVFRGGFIEDSLEIMGKFPNIVQCAMRDDWGHTVIEDKRFPFPVMEPNWAGGWSGFCFNPGLKRLSDYKKIGGYGRHVGYDPRFVGELELSKLYRSLGFFTAKIKAACKHIGTGARHVPWLTSAPKVLIAIPVCHKYDYTGYQDKRIGHVDRGTNERVEAIRATWQKYAKAFSAYVDLKFFYGTGGNRKPDADEVFLNAPDDYAKLPHKVKAIYLWALENGYTNVFKCDDDTFVYVDRLLASGFEHYDYLGYCWPSHGNYISGGPGYWLSRRAMKIVTKNEVNDWAEDKWVGRVLAQDGIRPARDARYLPGFSNHYVDLGRLPEDHSYISFHACKPSMMQTLYDRNPAPNFKLVRNAIGEGEIYRDANEFPLNVKPIEQVFTGEALEHADSKQKRPEDTTDGRNDDPRRRPWERLAANLVQ